MGLAVELTGPAIPCLFMGTEFFNAAPFAATPAAIDWSFLADATHAQTRLLALTRALIAVRLELQLHAGKLQVRWWDDELGLLCYVVENPVATLLGVINTSSVDYACGCRGGVRRSMDEVAVPAPMVQDKTWTSVFSSESPSYSSYFSEETSEVRNAPCADASYDNCITTSFHSTSVRLFAAM